MQGPLIECKKGAPVVINQVRGHDGEGKSQPFLKEREQEKAKWLKRILGSVQNHSIQKIRDSKSSGVLVWMKNGGTWGKPK